MKRLTPTLAALLLAVSLQAKPVDPALLLHAASRVLQRTDLVEATPDGYTLCRLFAGADGRGFVLLSADDCVRPLLGYSPESAFPATGLPEHVSAWLDAYQREIASAIANGSRPSAQAADEWSRLLSDRVPLKAVATAVTPLLKTQWGQGSGFNELCPYDSATGTRCVTGCVATAGAQVLKYWNHPEVGRGSHSYTHSKYGVLEAVFDTAYDWNHMPNKITSTTMFARRMNVSLLMYHYGVAVDMGYSPSASGANTNPLGNVKRASSETALKEFFRYNPALFTAYKEGFSDAQWRALIDEDLDAARPVLYDGYGPAGGHAFVLDGRDTLGLYHFNWGWDGEANGFFTLDSLSPYSTMSFSQLNSAIFRIFPIEVNPAGATVTGVSGDPSRGTVSGSGTYPTDTMRVLLLATAKPGYRFDHWTSGNPANPIITSPTADITDTACFVPLNRDTVGYCRPNGIAYKNLTDSSEVEWGIRIPPDYLAGKARLREVQFWTYEAFGPYIFRIYRGDVPSDDNLVYLDSLTATGYGMNVLPLPDDVAVDFGDTVTPLWITVYAHGSPFPISYSHFTGTADGSWVKYNGQWTPMYEVLPLYGTWMLRAVIDPPTPVGLAGPVAETPLAVAVTGRTVSADAPADTPVALYDVQGRCLAAARGSLRVVVPAAGLYMVRAASSVRKAVVR